MGYIVALVFSTLLFIPPSIANAQTVTAVWDPSPSGDLVSGYQVCVGTSSLSCSVKNASVSASTTAYTFAPAGGIVHYVAIRAVNGLGAGAYSPEVRFSIPSFAQPANQSSKVGVAITPLTLSVKDPDGSRLAYTHTGLPVGLKLDSATGTISGTPSSVGTYNVTAYVSDGLVTVSRSWTWTVTTSSSSDTSAPALTITSHTSGQTVSTSTVTIAGTATDSGRGGSGIKRVTVNGLATSGGTATGSGTANWSRSISLVKGSNTITVEAADGAGNVSMKQFTLYYGTTSSASVTGATLTSNLASPQKPGTTITFTASGSGGVAPLQYKFLVKVGTGSFQTVRAWSTANKFAWTPTLAGSYTIAVWVRSDGVTKDAPQASAQKAFSISKTASSTDTTAPALSITSHTSGQTVTTSTVTIAGKATDGNRGGSGITGVRVNGLAASGGTATGSNTASWSRSISLVKGSNTITVEATDGAGNVSMRQFTLNYGTSSTSVTSAKLISNLASPQKPGTTITFTASGSGGVTPLQYKFLVKTGTGSYQTVRGWNTANKFAWTPTLTGSYTVAVWVRSDGVTKDAPQASAQMAFSIKR